MQETLWVLMLRILPFFNGSYLKTEVFKQLYLEDKWKGG
jgi:hypothetical protein